MPSGNLIMSDYQPSRKTSPQSNHFHIKTLFKLVKYGLSVLLSGLLFTGAYQMWKDNLFDAHVSIVTTSSAIPAQASRTQTVQRIFIIQLENSAYTSVLANPYFANLASRGRLLNNYYAVTHPSQPNYIAEIAGDTFVTDDSSHDLPQSNLVDLLEGAGISWKTYQEDYPGQCSAVSSAAGGLYARKHNPFVSFDSVRTNPARCAKIVNASQLGLDITANTLPQYSFYVPNQNNDGHDTGIAYAADWLQGFLEPKLTNSNFMSGTLIVVTFDEDDHSQNNHVYTVLLGDMISAGTDSNSYNHYSLLRMVENNFGLATLGRNDASANAIAIPFLSVATPTNTPLPTTTATMTTTPSPTEPLSNTTSTATSAVTPTRIATDPVRSTATSTLIPAITPTATSTPSPFPTATATTGPGTPLPPSPTAANVNWRVYLPVVINPLDSQPGFPVRAAFYYPWFPQAWRQSSIYPFTHYTPTLGFYDGSEASLILKHLDAMQYAHIQAGIASWWGVNLHTDLRFARILSTTTANNNTFRWGLYYEKESTGDPTVTEIQSDLAYIKTHYSRDQSFWRINGRFVIFVYASGSDNCDMAKRWKQASAGMNAYVVLKVFSGYALCLDQPENWHQYGPVTPTDQQANHSFTISPGFWLKGSPEQLVRDLDRWKTNIRSMVASDAQFQLITTFNEWGEGTAIESAQQWDSLSGYGQYLDALHNDGAP